MTINKITDRSQLDELLSFKNCYLYGAGKVSRIILKYAAKNHFSVSGVVVSDIQNNPTDIMGVIIKSLSEMKNYLENRTVIVCVKENLHEEILKTIQENDVRIGQLYFISDAVFFEVHYLIADYDVDIYKDIQSLEQQLNRINAQIQRNVNDRYQRILQEIMYLRNGVIKTTPQPRLQYFILNIVDHCNLNCKGCNHFSSLAKSKNIEVKTIEKDLHQMYAVHGDVPRIGIMGGEPLLHPELNQILWITRRIFKKAKILLSTNGVMLKRMDDDFWNTCIENDIVLRFTKYPIRIDYDELDRMAQERGVKTDYFSNGEICDTFNSLAMDITGSQDARVSFFECEFANQCVFLNEGKLYPCQVIANCKYFSKEFHLDMPVEDEDYIDIYRHSREKVLDLLSKPVPFCRFCNVRKRKSTSYEWEVTKKCREEWIEK